MYKTESKSDQTRSQSTVHQKKSSAVKSPQGEQAASLKDRAESSLQMAKQAQLAEMIDASPAMSAQRKRIDTNQNSSLTIAQRKFVESIQHGSTVAAQRGQAQSPAKQNDTGLPGNLKSGIENPSGTSMGAVKAHCNSPQPAQLSAHAYAQGNDIHIASGQEQHLPHEAWHAVQQAQSRSQPTAQMKNGALINDGRPLEQEADVMGERALQLKTVAQLATPEEEAEEKAAWHTADQVQGNNLLDMGHISGNILKKAYLWDTYKDLAKRKRINELATKKAHLIEKNMYGRGKIGAVMRNLDTASRIMHLIGSISGLIALAANIAAFFAPAALPVGAVAGVIALAAHSAMVVLQTILIGRNLYRIRGLPEAEKAKILPTLYRDIAKLGFGILGVVTGGVGLGGAMQSGGIMANHALEGAEVTAHGLHLGGDIVGDTVGTYAMGGAIHRQNEKEIAIGMAGGLDHHAKHHAPAAKHHASAAEPSSDSQVEVMRADLLESTEAVSNMGSASQEAMSGSDGLASEIKPLEDLSAAEPKAQQALASLQGGEVSLPGTPDEAELDAKSAKVTEAEDKLGLPKSEEDKDQQQETSEVETVQQISAGTAQMQATAQRDKKPGLLSRAAGWFKRKFSSFKKRVKKVIKGIQGKLTELVLKLAGVKNLPAQMNEALTEQRIEAAQVTEHANAGKEAIAEWKSAADKIGKQK